MNLDNKLTLPEQINLILVHFLISALLFLKARFPFFRSFLIQTLFFLIICHFNLWDSKSIIVKNTGLQSRLRIIGLHPSSAINP